jgi:hypothetical protein
VTGVDVQVVVGVQYSTTTGQITQWRKTIKVIEVVSDDGWSVVATAATCPP